VSDSVTEKSAETPSFTTYLVGGAVRDALLGRPVRERDWVVVGATPEQMLAAGFRQADEKFPVFLHPQTGEEYALARRERKVAPGYRGFELICSPQVTLLEDLQRRDLTVNAMARDAEGNLIDPFNGQHDLDEGRLRHVTEAFVEDPVRLLRIARFAAKLGEGFRVAHATHRLLKRMVADGAVAELQAQRVGREMGKALACEAPWRFFEVLGACGALAELMPGLAGCFGTDAHGDHSTCPPLRVLRRAAKLSEDAAVRLAALALQSDDDVSSLTVELAMPKNLRDLVRAAQQAWRRWQTLNRSDADQVVAFLGELRAWQAGSHCEAVLLALQAQSADGEAVARLRRAWSTARAVSAASLQQQGVMGPALGRALAVARADAIRALD
jgi:tRNA nucleotidyltransferase (CCA-adding enzyme)